jgi:hypothetical protein
MVTTGDCAMAPVEISAAAAHVNTSVFTEIYSMKDAANKTPQLVARLRRRRREAKRALRNFPLRDPFDKLPRGACKFSSTSFCSDRLC